MKAEFESIVHDVEQSLSLLRRSLDWETAERRLAELNAKAENPDLWSDPKAAQRVMRERTRLEASVNAYLALERDLRDSVDLIELASEEGDAETLSEAEASLRAVAKTAKTAELESLLAGEADANETYLEIHAGAGGTESQDWASILLRMYTRWADAHGRSWELIEESPGEEAGIKSATIHIKGENAYGWLKTESGVHRLVRISPFDSNARRHTSFASVWVYPVVDDEIDIEVDEKDVRIDVYRASGAGGQHVNKTESAVRITHNPTGIVVQCQSDRSQHKNRATAWAMLKARLYEAELKRREEVADVEAAAKTEIGWGHQIRSYVLQPYQLVKDLRTGVESTAPDDVLDGDLDAFMAAALAQRVKGPGENASADAE
ncbi:MAG: peptide chain release factor 2 [Alphaproteobacteria bacterium]|nr:peptide chain release factor 2 [Alphaproteobacteria bacterium]